MAFVVWWERAVEASKTTALVHSPLLLAGAALSARTSAGAQPHLIMWQRFLHARNSAVVHLASVMWRQPQCVCPADVLTQVLACPAGDVIYTNTPIQGEGRPQGAGTRVQDVQYFWEAFPAGSGPTDRTTYMFAYMDAQPSRRVAPVLHICQTRGLC